MASILFRPQWVKAYKALNKGGNLAEAKEAI